MSCCMSGNTRFDQISLSGTWSSELEYPCSKEFTSFRIENQKA